MKRSNIKKGTVRIVKGNPQLNQLSLPWIISKAKNIGMPIE